MAVVRDKRVDDYITFAAPFARPVFLKLRQLIHRACPDVVEGIKWGAPFFSYEGKILCFFAEFKAHTAFGFWHQDMKKIVRAEHRKGTGMGLFGRITSVPDLPADKDLLKYLKAAMAINESGRKSVPARKARPELTAPPELVDALRRNTKAQAHWVKFSPGARRDYIEWILDAKRAETREPRLLTTLEWVADGRKRHWKYEKG